MEKSISLLKTLGANAVFSLVSALLLAVFGRWVATQLGLEGALPVYVVAIVLVLFGLQLASIARTRQFRSAQIYAVIAADFGWVAASIVFAAMFYQSITFVGLVLIDVVALIVLIFAILQVLGLRVHRSSIIDHR